MLIISSDDCTFKYNMPRYKLTLIYNPEIIQSILYDKEFEIKSTRTGMLKKFVYYSVIYDKDIQAIIYYFTTIDSYHEIFEMIVPDLLFS